MTIQATIAAPAVYRRGWAGRAAPGVLALALVWTGLAAPSTAGAGTPAARGADYPLFAHDAARSGTNPGETTLAPAGVGRLRRLWAAQLAGPADSSPIEMAGAGPGGSDLLFLTTTRGITYALDARTGRTVWETNTVAGEALRQYQITTSTPAADPSRTWIYAPSPDGRIHKLAVAGGHEAPGWPVAVTRHAQDEKISSALNLIDGTLLVTTSGYVGDFGHYEGHVVAIDTRTRALRVFNTLCSTVPRLLAETPSESDYCPAVLSGVWARAGTVVDTTAGSPTKGQIFIATGNAPWDGRTSWGDSILRLALGPAGFTLRDSFTPPNQQALEQSDADLGSTTPILLPRQPGRHPWLALQGGKDNQLRLIDRANMSGQGGPGHLGGSILSVPMPQGGDMFATGIAWQDGAGTWIVVADYQGIAALQLTVTSGAPRLTTRWVVRGPATSPVLAGGMLFAAGSGAVRALDPHTGRLLWSSGAIGEVHWQSLTVVNGRVFMPDQGGRVTAFGLP